MSTRAVIILDTDKLLDVVASPEHFVRALVSAINRSESKALKDRMQHYGIEYVDTVHRDGCWIYVVSPNGIRRRHCEEK
jgi:hypothetical protein